MSVNPALVSLSWKIQGQITAVPVVPQVREKKEKLLLGKDSESVFGAEGDSCQTA